MKTRVKKLFPLPALIAGVGLMLMGRAAAQTFTTLHNFTAIGTSGTNRDGTYPFAGLIISNNTLYGTAEFGGTNGNGTVFAVNADGSGFTNLYNFSTLSPPLEDYLPYGTNSDGAFPYAGLILSGNTLYGTAVDGGGSGFGTVFAIDTNGAGFKVVYSFFGGANGPSGQSDGAYPESRLVLSGGTLYGTTYEGGNSGVGTIFAVNTNGSSFTTLFKLNELVAYHGGYPVGALVLSGTNLYGESSADAVAYNQESVVFTADTGGSSYNYLHVFTSAYINGQGYTTNSGEARPNGGLILSGNTLYGTTEYGGSGGYGTVFAVNTTGSGFTTLYNFTNGIDGANPVAGLILSGNTLYGTAPGGGSESNGTVFALNINTMTLTNLHSFTATVKLTNSDGAVPEAGLILSGNTLYGTASQGGTGGYGTVFALTVPMPPSVGIAQTGNKIVLSWQTNATGVTLQSTTNLSSGTWSNVTNGIKIAGANNVFTNTVNGNAAFFRLTQP